jgi:predicted DNA-binding transcriptional regulator
MVLDRINSLLKQLCFNKSEVEIYKLLLRRGEMTVKEIAEELQLSTRIVRERLKRLVSEGIVGRRLIERGWIGYVYYAEDPNKVAQAIKRKLLEVVSRIDNIS